MPKLDLSPLDDLFSKGKDFELTAAQYEEKVGKPMPGSTPGIKGKKAPLAKKARENGFVISEIVDRPVIMRTVKFTKE